jgi:hypothetical protein
MATTTDHNYLKENLLDDEDSPPEFTRSQVRPSRKSFERMVPLQSSATSSETIATLSSAADRREFVFQPPSQTDRQFPPQGGEPYVQEALRNPFQPPIQNHRQFLPQESQPQLQDIAPNPFQPPNQRPSPHAPPVQTVPLQQGDSGRTNRGNRLVIAIDYGTTYTGNECLR